MLVPGHIASNSVESVDPEIIIVFAKPSLYLPASDYMCEHNFPSVGKVLCLATKRLSDKIIDDLLSPCNNLSLKATRITTYS
jgi:hypothetical protein